MKKLTAIVLCIMAVLCAACGESAPTGQQTEQLTNPLFTESEKPQSETPGEDNVQIKPGESAPAPERTPEPTEAPTEAPAPEPTEAPTPTPEPTPQQVYGAPQSFKPTKALTDDQLPVVYRMYDMNPKGKKEAQMFTYDLNRDGKAEKISFKLDTKKNRTTITAGKKSIRLDEGSDLVSAMLVDLDPETPYTDLVVIIDMGSDDYVTIALHVADGKLVRGETLEGVMVGLGTDGVMRRYEDTDLLGTHSGSCACHGEHFTPDDEWLGFYERTEEEIQEEISRLEDFSWLLLLKRELPCSINGEPATLPVGTMLYLTRFHASRTLAEVRTTDGVTAVITFTTDEDGWPYLINGIPQDDYFEYELLYAD